jgi:hypothetical protein
MAQGNSIGLQSLPLGLVHCRDSILDGENCPAGKVGATLALMALSPKKGPPRTLIAPCAREPGVTSE